MKKGWTEVALGDVLEPRIDSPAEETIMCGGVRIVSKIKFATGSLEYRSSVQTKTKMILIHPGDLVVSGINAAKGAIAIYPQDAKVDASATIHYSSYKVNSIADSKFLWWLLRSSEFRRILEIYLPGGIKTELKAKRLLPIPVHLPPLSEQKRIAAHLDAVEERLKQIQKLRAEQEQEFLAALRSAFHRIESTAEWVEIGDVAPLVRRPVEIKPDGKYPELGVRSFGRGVFHKPTLNGADLSWQKLFQVNEGDIIISNIKAWEGALAVAREADHGRVGSHRYLTCVIDSDRVLPEIICFYLLSHAGLEKIGRASPGSADRNRTLAVKRLEKIKVPVPPMKLQKEFLSLLKLRDRIKQEADKSTQRQEALQPSLLDRIFGDDRI